MLFPPSGGQRSGATAVVAAERCRRSDACRAARVRARAERARVRGLSTRGPDPTHDSAAGHRLPRGPANRDKPVSRRYGQVQRPDQGLEGSHW